MMTTSPDRSEDAARQLEVMAETIRNSYQTVEEKTQSFIRDAILHGIYRPGERLQQDQIAALLGVSRMPVRASLRQLETEGLVSSRPYMGATVSILRAEEIAELYELRILLESYLLEHAIPKLTSERLAELWSLVRQADYEGEDALGDRLERRKVFYRRLYELANRPRALETADRLREGVGRYLLLKRVDEHPAAHQELLDHLEARDIEAAKGWLTDHLNKVSGELQRLIAGTETSASTDHEHS